MILGLVVRCGAASRAIVTGLLVALVEPPDPVAVTTQAIAWPTRVAEIFSHDVVALRS